MTQAPDQKISREPRTESGARAPLADGEIRVVN
jgi:hypothetical protein